MEISKMIIKLLNQVETCIKNELYPEIVDELTDIDDIEDAALSVGALREDVHNAILLLGRAKDELRHMYEDYSDD